MNSAPFSEAQNFEDVRDCRDDNRDTCNTQADSAYNSCNANCSTGDTACSNVSDNDHENRLEGTCEVEYTTCGILGNASTPQQVTMQQPLTFSRKHVSTSGMRT